MKSILPVLLIVIAATRGVAAESSYVFCDNGLRCVKAPCPSSNALDLATGSVTKGVSIDTERLAEKDRTADLPNRLYAGTAVLTGFIETREVTYTGRNYSLPYLVASGVERDATPGESARCKAR